MKFLKSLAAGAAIVALVATPAVAMIISRVPLAPDDSQLPGRHADGSVQLINQRTITPAGQQSDLGDVPLNAILSPDGKRLLVSNSGAGVQSLEVVDTSSGKILQDTKYLVPDSVFIGLTYSPDGKKVYASGGGSNLVHTFSVGSDGLLTPTGDWKRATQSTPLGDAPWPLGLSVSPDGKTLYVADNLGNDVALIDTATGSLITTIPVGSFPYPDLVSRDGKRVYVSNWGDATISAIDTNTHAVTTIKVGDHPSAMLLGKGDLLFVADANSDAISVIHTDRNVETGRISLAPYPKAPLSTSPVGLALSPDGTRLYDTSAMLRTIELILGLHPLSQFDANATPIRHLFRGGELSEEQLEPYSALNESISATDLNATTAFGAEASAAMDFEQEDRAPMMALNQVIWHAIKGADVPYPDSAIGAAADADGGDGA